ncbi:hypothetical protein MASR2M78_01970 [Treponema sp.]
MGIYKFGNMVERAEYYEGRRIDQAYIIREEREKDRIERVRIAEAAEQQRREQEEQQRIEAKRIAQKQRDEAEKANKAQQDKSLLAWGFAAATGLVGMDKGLDVLEATQLGISVYDDIVNDRGGSSVKQKSAEIIAARQANASSESKSRTDSGRFNELPGSSLNGDYKSGGNIVGTWKDGKGSTVTFGSRGEFRYKMTKSINNNPGQLEMIGTYSYDTTSQILTYTIMSTELSGSAGYDKAEPSNKTYSEKAIVLGSTLTFGGGSYTR